MAVHARASKRQGRREPRAGRQPALRTVLLVLALVPIVTLVALWAVDSAQLYTDWRRQQDRNDVSTQAARPVLGAFFSLQEERRLSEATLADPAAYRKQLSAQRARTDAAVKAVEALPDSGWNAPADIRGDVVDLGRALRSLAGYRDGVDGRTASPQRTFDDYTGLISRHLKVFNTLSTVGLPGIDHLVRPVIDEDWGAEMISREDALLTRASVSGKLTGDERAQLAAWIGAQQFIYDDKVVPLLSDDEARQFRKLMAGSAWKKKTAVEQAVLAGSATGGDTDRFSKDLGRNWRDSVQQVYAQLQERNASYAKTLTDATDKQLRSMETRLIVTSVTNAVAVLVVALITALFTRMLRRRISALRTAALDLQTRLPDVVARLRRGEVVDQDAELPAIQHGGDELGQLGRALNLARHTALDTTVTQVGQLHGFEKLLQRIARRTQLLIGLQMKKLSELERKHEDPEVLEDLFDLDHLTARLRRYEENLVILGGGQPQRRWRKPVLVLDVLRSAQSEVQDYRRIQIEVQGRVWLSERAVGLVIHVLAELMENAVGFSRPPTPVEVYAAQVGRGLAVEIEDRGVGMDAEQYEAVNRMMADPPRMDVMSRADDVRLGLYVVARLAQGLGIQVELRPSAFGGTRVVVLIPDELVVIDDSAPVEEIVSSWPPAPAPVPDPVTSDVESAPVAAVQGPEPRVRRPATTGAPPGAAALRERLQNGSGRPRPVPRQFRAPGPGDGPAPGDGADPVTPPRRRLPSQPFGPAPVHAASAQPTPAHPTPVHSTPDHPAPGHSTRPDHPAPHSMTPGHQAPAALGAPARTAGPDVIRPLPKRVRQASLADELRDPDAAVRPSSDEREAGPRPTPARSGATIGAFQRQSRMARRTTPTADRGPADALPTRRSSPTED
ncbi:nitrate- and nitrite sensing domain-containing protein [Streptomyces griseorubiginosus]|uniref:sensor histidine kinase n=1 Tax=Streptomyces griseorubiginosus TaxID=67304 RepID=UPI002E819647|nr:nitrate- and nitrite sensing domain-containing protein [Streptomyces griseorubiginosus]WUB41968.1 nitrate- and nitrite sensing domain-containing protein [Streptomyces griseorubiginosus]WUB50488.1 nitrate- and nitrite sensing domain-containing protein [Streptomyces griseorubiginosus]